MWIRRPVFDQCVLQMLKSRYCGAAASTRSARFGPAHQRRSCRVVVKLLRRHGKRMQPFFFFCSLTQARWRLQLGCCYCCCAGPETNTQLGSAAGKRMSRASIAISKSLDVYSCFPVAVLHWRGSLYSFSIGQAQYNNTPTVALPPRPKPLCAAVESVYRGIMQETLFYVAFKNFLLQK